VPELFIQQLAATRAFLLCKENVHLTGQEKGAGSRELLDEKLRHAGVSASAVNGIHPRRPRTPAGRTRGEPEGSRLPASPPDPGPCIRAELHTPRDGTL